METSQDAVEQGSKIIVTGLQLETINAYLSNSDPNIPPGEYLFPNNPDVHAGLSASDTNPDPPRLATNPRLVN